MQLFEIISPAWHLLQNFRTVATIVATREVAMAVKIGVRQLKNEASRILRDVRNNGEQFILTVDGEEVAMITPIASRVDAAQRLAIRARALEDADKLAHEVALAWKSTKSAAEEVAEGRS